MILLESRSIGKGEGHSSGRALLKAMYETHTGQAMPQICVAPRGKPYFVEGTLYFSISHTKRHVFCVLSDKPVGIDAEELDREISGALAEKILSPAEKVQYDAAQDQRLALLTFWVLKEAQAKYTGMGLQGYPNQTDFSLDDPRVIQRDNCLVAVIGEENHAF